jgi:hypothetical protein
MRNQNPVVLAFENPTLAQDARVGHPPWAREERQEDSEGRAQRRERVRGDCYPRLHSDRGYRHEGC